MVDRSLLNQQVVFSEISLQVVIHSLVAKLLLNLQQVEAHYSVVLNKLSQLMVVSSVLSHWDKQVLAFSVSQPPLHPPLPSVVQVSLDSSRLQEVASLVEWARLNSNRIKRHLDLCSAFKGNSNNSKPLLSNKLFSIPMLNRPKAIHMVARPATSTRQPLPLKTRVMRSRDSKKRSI